MINGEVMKLDPQLRSGRVRNGMSIQDLTPTLTLTLTLTRTRTPTLTRTLTLIITLTQDENLVRNVAAHFGLALRRFPAVQYLRS